LARDLFLRHRAAEADPLAETERRRPRHEGLAERAVPEERELERDPAIAQQAACVEERIETLLLAEARDGEEPQRRLGRRRRLGAEELHRDADVRRPHAHALARREPAPEETPREVVHR